LYELPQDESVLIKSTYKDNPFLPESIKRQIEDLKRTDEAQYQIYALGEKAISRTNIYNTWEFLSDKPMRFKNYVYGLDFGYNHPTALMRVYWCDNDIYIEPVIYESYLTTSELIEKFKTLNINQTDDILADYSRPEIIAEMQNAGYNVNNANKVVKQGIDYVKSFKVYAKDDKRIIREYENYKYKKVGDMITDEPVKMFDDAMDAVRYAVTFIKEMYFTNDSYISF
jgi:phage terminase large subunit